MMLVCASISALCAQDGSEAFLARARATTEKYQDQSLAILDGYRRIGRDFPAMGQHWIRINLLFDGKIDAEQPEFLTYIEVSGKPVLLGVAYALPLLSGESVPDLPPGREAWHDHFRTIEDETALPHHHRTGSLQDEPRIAMLHAWIWSTNPDGMFAADNWAVPYLRLGLAPPSGFSRAAAMALSLLTGGVDYFAATVDAVAAPDMKQRAAMATAIEAARTAVERKTHRQDLDGLADVWTKLWTSIESALTPEAREHLRSVLPSW
jgi:hypothetical protein